MSTKKPVWEMGSVSLKFEYTLDFRLAQRDCNCFFVGFIWCCMCCFAFYPKRSLLSWKEVFLQFLHSFRKNIINNWKIRVPKVPFHVFNKVKNGIQKFIIRFCFYLNMKNKIEIIDYYFQVKIHFYSDFNVLIRLSFS